VTGTVPHRVWSGWGDFGVIFTLRRGQFFGLDSYLFRRVSQFGTVTVIGPRILLIWFLDHRTFILTKPECLFNWFFPLWFYSDIWIWRKARWSATSAKKKDMVNGWCPYPSICEDNFCYKANATLSEGHYQLQLGCMSFGDVGCTRDGDKNDMQAIFGNTCICDTDLCNAIPKPVNSAQSKFSSSFFITALCPGLMSFIFTFSYFFNQISLWQLSDFFVFLK